MRKKRFSVEQIIGVLKQAEVGVPVAEVIRKAGISEQTFYRWKAKYAGLEVDQVRQMARLVHLQATVLFPPPVVCLFRDLRFLARQRSRLPVRNSHFNLPQHVHHLLSRMLLPSCHRSL